MKADLEYNSWNDLVDEAAIKTKKRFSLILLDLFMGGFAVGIVLMMPLSRAPSDVIEVGGGGPRFMLIEFYWEGNSRKLVPILMHKSKSKTKPENPQTINRAGIGSHWGGKHSQLWPSHNKFSGKLDGVKKRFSEIQMDGFDIGADYNLKGRNPATGTSQNYGYIWMSQPCDGDWTIGFKEIDRAYSTSETQPLKVYTHVRYEGYDENDSDEKPIYTIENKALLSKNVTDGLFDSGSKVIRKISIPQTMDAEFDYCPK